MGRAGLCAHYHACKLEAVASISEGRNWAGLLVVRDLVERAREIECAKNSVTSYRVQYVIYVGKLETVGHKLIVDVPKV